MVTLRKMLKSHSVFFMCSRGVILNFKSPSGAYMNVMEYFNGGYLNSNL